VTQWIGAAEAAERLGIKPASLYAYVSRGVLTRRREPDGRASMFDAEEIEELAHRGRPRRLAGGAGPAELVIESALTEITPTTQRYRGYGATELALRCRFEDVATLLWTGTLPGAGERESAAAAGPGGSETVVAGEWTATSAAVAAGRAAQAALPAETLPLERIQVIVPALAATDQFRLHLDPPAVVAAGKALIAGLTEALPAASTEAAGRPGTPGGIAARLATRLCPAPATTGLIRVVNAALILVADHELAASTLAARVAASMRADPYAVVSTGLGAMTGALHGGAALGAELMLGSADTAADAPRVVGDVLRRGEKLPGFGHFVYRDGDPRANLLLRLIAEYAPDSERLAVASAVTAEARRRAVPDPNIEFALAVLAAVAGMVRGAGEAMFATGRTAGWLAHALEEYERNVPIRPRCVYTGPRER
jgi:citrate synthase